MLKQSDTSARRNRERRSILTKAPLMLYRRVKRLTSLSRKQLIIAEGKWGEHNNVCCQNNTGAVWGNVIERRIA